MAWRKLSDAERKMRLRTETTTKLSEKLEEARRAREVGNFYRAWQLYEDMFTEVLEWIEAER